MKGFAFLVFSLALIVPAFAEDGCPFQGDPTKPDVQEGQTCSASTGNCAQGFNCLPTTKVGECVCALFPDPMKGKAKP